MASTFKTFADGDILSATDVNNGLNPQTADHLARSMHTQVVPVTITGARFADVTISFPAGRFSTAPVCLASLASDAGDVSAAARAWSTGVTSGKVRVGIPATSSGVFSVLVVAIQMTPGSATG